ncbi:hypothetical protein SRHO_G00214730 [Serrasalmus rhombeus]
MRARGHGRNKSVNVKVWLHVRFVRAERGWVGAVEEARDSEFRHTALHKCDRGPGGEERVEDFGAAAAHAPLNPSPIGPEYLIPEEGSESAPTPVFWITGD